MFNLDSVQPIDHHSWQSSGKPIIESSKMTGGGNTVDDLQMLFNRRNNLLKSVGLESSLEGVTPSQDFDELQMQVTLLFAGDIMLDDVNLPLEEDPF